MSIRYEPIMMRAIDAVREAGEVILSSGIHRVRAKGAADFVTDVDVAVQGFLARQLAAIAPNVQFMGEEKDNSAIDPARPFWILDPVDGTTNLIHGLRLSAVSLAYAEGGAVRFGLLLSAGVGAVGTLLLALAADPLLRHCFRAGAEAVAMGGPALAMTALAFPVGAVTIILSASFQALGRAGLSLLVSLLRQIALLLPIAALFLALRPGLVWLSFLCAEVLACLAAAGLYLRLIRPRVRALE